MNNETDTPNDAAQESPAEQTTDESPSESDSRFEANTVVTYLQWGALLAFAMLAVIAGIGLYTSLGSIIDVWVTREYRPFARTGLNLAVLAAAVGGIVAIVRRL